MSQITVLEKATEVGGWMTSHRDENTGAVFENGPRSLRASGPQAMSSLALVSFQIPPTNMIVKFQKMWI